MLSRERANGGALIDVVVGCSCNTSTTTRNRAAEAPNGPLTDAEKRALVAVSLRSRARVRCGAGRGVAFGRPFKITIR